MPPTSSVGSSDLEQCVGEEIFVALDFRLDDCRSRFFHGGNDVAMDVALLHHSVKLKNLSIERCDCFGNISNVSDCSTGHVLENVGAAGQHVPEVALKIQLADQ